MKVGLENIPYLTRGYGYIKCAMAGCVHSNERVTIGNSDDKCLWKELEIYRSEYMEN